MANQIIVSDSGNVQVAIQPTPNVQVQISRAVIGTVANVQSANYANFAGEAFDVSGANVTGTVANATYAISAGSANTAQTVTSASQPNITSVGTLNGLTSSANIVAPYFIGNVVGNIAGNIVVPGTNTSVLFNQTGSAGASDALQFDYAANVLSVDGNVSATNLSGNGAGLSSITGANVTGTVANASYATNAGHATVSDSANSVAGANVSGEVANANFADIAGVAYSVAVANVSGLGNIATINLNGSNAQVLYGNGIWAAAGGAGDSNYANFAGEAFNVSGANVTGTVANASYATNAGHATVSDSANAVAGANVSGQVAYAAVANSVAGANVSGQVAYAAVANSVAGANVSGAVNLATYATTANAVAGANVSGQVANALVAGTVYTNAQPNITSVGTLTSLAVAGNITGPDVIAFDTANGTGTLTTGQMSWDTAERTMSLGMLNGVTQQIGLETYIVVKASSAITDGQVVMFTGANGDNILAAPANAASVGFKADYIIGIATQDIALNGFGYITVFGQVHGLNTNAYNVGDILWYDPASTTGGLTATQPVDPNYQIQIGAVTKKSSGDGHIQVRVSPVPSLNLLTDVTITTPTTGQALVYNGSNVWINGNPNIANIAYSVDGANVSGEVANAAYAVNADYAASAGVAYSVDGANVVGEVANAAYAVNAGTAEIAGVAYSVDGANVVGSVANAGYADIAGVAYSVDVANVVGIGNIATINLDGSSSNVLYGNGTWAPAAGGGGDANYANYAGNVVNASQGNITQVGNLVNLTIADSNVSNPITQFIPTSNVIGTSTFSNAMLRIDNYNDLGNANSVQTVAFVKSRGNSVSPTPAANNDTIMRVSSYVYNGNTYPKAVQIDTLAPVAANTTLQLANTAWTGGTARIITGNPNGNVANASASSNQNLLQFNQTGGLTLVNGTHTNGAVSPSLYSITYGTAANGVGTTGLVTLARARGSRDGNLAVGTGDTLGGIGFQAYNGNAFFATRFAQIRGNVNTAHGAIANGASVPTDLVFTTCSNTTSYTTTLYGNGAATFPGLIATTGNVSAGNVSTGKLSAANTVSVTMDNISTVSASFAFSTYNDANALVNPYTFFRARGTLATPTAVSAGDTVSSVGYNIYADSGNTYAGIASTSVVVLTNDGAGSYSGEYNIAASKISMTGNLHPTNVVFSKYNETVYPGGSVSGTLTPDLASGSIHQYTLTGGITIDSLANAVAGSSMTIILTQDGTGGHTLSSTMKFAGGNKTLSTAGGAIDIMSVFYDGTTYYATLSTGYA